VGDRRGIGGGWWLHTRTPGCYLIGLPAGPHAPSTPWIDPSLEAWPPNAGRLPAIAQPGRSGCSPGQPARIRLPAIQSTGAASYRSAARPIPCRALGNVLRWQHRPGDATVLTYEPDPDRRGLLDASAADRPGQWPRRDGRGIDSSAPRRWLGRRRVVFLLAEGSHMRRPAG
jgi:hypothetical protein